MVRATDFGKGQTNVWAKTLMWQRDIFECGRMCEKDRSARAHELAVRIAKLELDAQNCATCLHAQWVTEDWGWCEVAETTDRGHALESLARARTQEGKPASLHIERHYGCVQWEGKA